MLELGPKGPELQIFVNKLYYTISAAPFSALPPEPGVRQISDMSQDDVLLKQPCLAMGATKQVSIMLLLFGRISRAAEDMPAT